MFQRLLPAIVIAFALIPSPAWSDDDPVRTKLDKAIAAYDTKLAKFNASVTAFLESREAAARKKGDKKAVDQIADERAEFENTGKHPTTLPRNVSAQLSSARTSLEAAYNTAIREYTKASEDEKAAATEKQLEEFQNGNALNLLHGDKLTQWNSSDAIASHWKLKDGVLRFDGAGKEVFDLSTKRSFKNFTLNCEWRIGPGCDSGIFLRGIPQVQIWDHTQGKGQGIGSGGLYNNQSQPRNPTLVADNAIGEWNAMSVTIVGDRVTVRLNGKTVTENIRMENYPQYQKPLPTEGPIVLQTFGSPIEFRRITIIEAK